MQLCRPRFVNWSVSQKLIMPVKEIKENRYLWFFYALFSFYLLNLQILQTSRTLLKQSWWGDDHKQNNTKLRVIFMAAFRSHYLAFAALTCVSMEAGPDMDTVTSR